MRSLWLAPVLLCVFAPAILAQSAIERLRAVEQRYNRVRTLEVPFTETYRALGQGRREAGTLYLLKPGRMRWDYSKPAGKQFVSDGKYFYLYSPLRNRAERTPVKESGDMHAPIAFLLGRLQFEKDFKRFESRPEGDNLFISATPHNPNLPYRLVEFLVAPDARMAMVRVIGQDESILEFRFGEEKVNPPLATGLFEFSPPEGVEIIEGVD